MINVYGLRVEMELLKKNADGWLTGQGRFDENNLYAPPRIRDAHSRRQTASNGSGFRVAVGNFFEYITITSKSI